MELTEQQREALLTELRGESTQGDCDLRNLAGSPSSLLQSREAGLFFRRANVGVAASEWNQLRRTGCYQQPLLL